MTIRSLYFTPFNMVVLLFLYRCDIPLPDNPTDLYKLFISITPCQHLAKLTFPCKQVTENLQNLPDPYGKIIQQLSRLSLDKLNNNQLVFTLDEMKHYCPELETIKGAINGFGLLQAVEHIDIFQTTKTFHFIHFSVQE